MTINIRKSLHRTEQKTKPVINTGKGLTEQAHKDETDMNYILRDYARTGFIKHAKDNQGKYDDIAVQDFQEAMFIVSSAKTMFEELPAAVRKRFGHDPASFLSFVQNPENKQEMAKMGILKGNDGIDINGATTNAPVNTPPLADEGKPSTDNGGTKTEQ